MQVRPWSSREGGKSFCTWDSSVIYYCQVLSSHRNYNRVGKIYTFAVVSQIERRKSLLCVCNTTWSFMEVQRGPLFTVFAVTIRVTSVCNFTSSLIRMNGQVATQPLVTEGIDLWWHHPFWGGGIHMERPVLTEGFLLLHILFTTCPLSCGSEPILKTPHTYSSEIHTMCFPLQSFGMITDSKWKADI